MSDSATHSLPLYQAALHRLDRAVGRLDAAVSRQTPPPNDSEAVAELQKLREDHARLDDASRVVGTRLDGIIERLQTVLGE